jgi:hypothetical protein
MDPHDRVRRLLALATDAGASPEEARTAAMTACRLIVKHKLLADGPARATDVAARRRPARESAANDDARPRRRAKPEPERASYRAKARGTCAFCRKPFGPEDDVMTNVDGSVDHWHCAKRRAAGDAPPTR